METRKSLKELFATTIFRLTHGFNHDSDGDAKNRRYNRKNYILQRRHYTILEHKLRENIYGNDLNHIVTDLWLKKCLGMEGESFKHLNLVKTVKELREPHEIIIRLLREENRLRMLCKPLQAFVLYQEASTQVDPEANEQIAQLKIAAKILDSDTSRMNSVLGKYIYRDLYKALEEENRFEEACLYAEKASKCAMSTLPDNELTPIISSEYAFLMSQSKIYRNEKDIGLFFEKALCSKCSDETLSQILIVYCQYLKQTLSPSHCQKIFKLLKKAESLAKEPVNVGRIQLLRGEMYLGKGDPKNLLLAEVCVDNALKAFNRINRHDLIRKASLLSTQLEHGSKPCGNRME